MLCENGRSVARGNLHRRKQAEKTAFRDVERLIARLQYNEPCRNYSRFSIFFLFASNHACFLSISTTLAFAPRTVSAFDLPP